MTLRRAHTQQSSDPKPIYSRNKRAASRLGPRTKYGGHLDLLWQYARAWQVRHVRLLIGVGHFMPRHALLCLFGSWCFGRRQSKEEEDSDDISISSRISASSGDWNPFPPTRTPPSPQKALAIPPNINLGVPQVAARTVVMDPIGRTSGPHLQPRTPLCNALALLPAPSTSGTLALPASANLVQSASCVDEQLPNRSSPAPMESPKPIWPRCLAPLGPPLGLPPGGHLASSGIGDTATRPLEPCRQITKIPRGHVRLRAGGFTESVYL